MLKELNDSNGVMVMDREGVGKVCMESYNTLSAQPNSTTQTREAMAESFQGIQLSVTLAQNEALGKTSLNMSWKL